MPDTPLQQFHNDEKSQTLIDAVLGISILLLVISGTVLVLPSLINPFDQAGESNAAIANRGADHLAQNLLTQDNPSYTLNPECTKDFFNGVPNQKCDINSASLPEIMGHDDSLRINVTLKNSTGVIHSIGDTRTDISSQIFIATRTVTMNDKVARLNYYVW